MDGYIKILVAGKEIGLKFGYLSYKIIMTDKNRPLLFEEDGTPNTLGICKIIYSGYQNNCINKNVEADISFEDFSREIDAMLLTETGVETLKNILNEWSQSSDIQDLIKDTEKKSPVEVEN